jgi:hypothetical protein
MNGLTVDRSGRTLEDYRELYWKFKAQAKELEAQPTCAVKEFGGSPCDEHVAEMSTRIAELEAKITETNKFWRKEIAELEAQIKVVKEMIDLYFEGCDCDTFDDKVREVRAALEPDGICGHGSG